jgi:S1-C subfamily serine protease
LEYRADGEELVVSHQDNPVIESVEPGSPAARAGLMAGDTVVAYNGSLLRGNKLSLTKMLRPGVTLAVRVKRDQEMKEIPVVIARRPSAWVAAGSGTEWVSVEPAEAAPRVAGGAPRQPPRVIRMPTPAPGTSQATPMPPVGFTFQVGNSVAGADLQRLKGDLAEIFGVERGVLVLDVVKGSLAERAGLRGGDVILEAGGDKVYTPADVRSAIAQAHDSRLSLQIMRKKKKQTLTLQWDG